ncbi:MAG: TetR family transcriptional regulator [Mycobacterium sp.]
MRTQAESGSARGGRRPNASRTGRRVGPSTTRGEIVDAARAMFAELGYERTTLRGVAARAGVNQALIYHFFHTKDDLLTATLDLPIEPAFITDALHDNPGREGEELIRAALAAWRQPAVREHFQALLRAGISHDHAAEMLRNLFATTLLDAFAAVIPHPDAQLRAALVGSQLAGIAVLRFMIGLDALADADDAILIDAVGPTLQRYLTGDLH